MMMSLKKYQGGQIEEIDTDPPYTLPSLLPEFIYYANRQDLIEIDVPGLIGRHVVLFTTKLYGIRKAQRCTSGGISGAGFS